jgi:hypothetical protein
MAKESHLGTVVKLLFWFGREKKAEAYKALVKARSKYIQ